MTVPETALAKAREMLATAKRPIFLHDDDADGTSSFVICYQFCRPTGEGRGVPIKRSPTVTKDFARNVKEFDADLIVVLDKPGIDVEFLEEFRIPILWVDHHEPKQDVVKPFPNVFYLNPRIWDDADNRPTSYWSYRITKTNLWIATVGSVADWHVPDYIDEFKREYPDIKVESGKIEELYLEGQIATLIRVIQFNLKGMTMESRKSVLTLSRVESPYEILQQTTARGKFLWRKYEKMARIYDQLLASAIEHAKTPGKILCYIYEDDSTTFTSELSNELMIRYPDRVILIGRHHDHMNKCSMRSKDVDLPPILRESIKGLPNATGGGHMHAVGLCVREEDWETFYQRLSSLI